MLATLHYDKAFENKARSRYHCSRCGLFPKNPWKYMHNHTDRGEYGNAIKYFKLAESMGSEPAHTRLLALGWTPKAADAQNCPTLLSKKCAIASVTTSPPDTQRFYLTQDELRKALLASQPELSEEIKRLLRLDEEICRNDILFDIFIEKYIYTIKVTDWLYLLQCAQYLEEGYKWIQKSVLGLQILKRASRILAIISDQDPALYGDQDTLDWSDTGIKAIKVARSMQATIYEYRQRAYKEPSYEQVDQSIVTYRKLAEKIVLTRYDVLDKKDIPPHKKPRIR